MLTIGHSNRPVDEFLSLLKTYEVELLIDVRTAPRSRHNPQFNRDVLPATLETAGIRYQHMPGLGGLRRPLKDSLNTGWKNLSFRGYADYMQTAEFARNLDVLQQLEQSSRVAIMCAESVPWRCHRSLVADALTVRGVRVRHILSEAKANPHRLTPFAQVDGTRVTYPSDALHLFHKPV